MTCRSSELKRFRQLHSKTPGHPEDGVTPGVETTTGPLGQGFANAVGMALAEKTLAAQFNRPGHDDRRSSHLRVRRRRLPDGRHQPRSGSLAGTLGLGKLIVIYDDNGISIDGQVDGNGSPTTRPNVSRPTAGTSCATSTATIRSAIDAALGGRGSRRRAAEPLVLQDRDRPRRAHQAGSLTTRTARRSAPRKSPRARAELDWPYAPFEMPDAVVEAWDARRRAARSRPTGTHRFGATQPRYPELAAEFDRRVRARAAGRLRGDGRRLRRSRSRPRARRWPRARPPRTRSRRSPLLPELFGGSADLAGSNLTVPRLTQPITASRRAATTSIYGVREFGMTAIDERRGAARRLHALRRHLPDVLRLRAQRGAHGGADAASA